MKDSILTVLQFVVALLLLPVIVASTVAFRQEVVQFDPGIREALATGMFIYVILYFFIYDFVHVYTFGQQVVGFCFQFLKPLMSVASFVIPIYTVITLIVYAILNTLGHAEGLRSMFFSVMAFTFSLHLILTARDLYSKDQGPGKPTYFFGMGLIYIFDMFFIALLMHITIPGFDFPHFFKSLAGVTWNIYQGVFAQLF